MIKKATRVIFYVQSLLCEVSGLFIKSGIQDHATAFGECRERGKCLPECQ